MKKLMVLLLGFVLIQGIFAIDLSIEKKTPSSAIIPGFNQPAYFDVTVRNNGASDNFRFYNLLGFSMAPKGTVFIGQGQSKKVQVMVYPRDNLGSKGFYTFQYFIKGSGNESVKDTLTLDILELGEAFEVGTQEINPETSSLEVYIKNKEHFDFQNMDAKFSSAFFEFEENLDLEPYEKKSFKIDLEQEDFKEILAGFYTLNVKLNIEGIGGVAEGTIKFNEKSLVESNSDKYGILSRTEVLSRVNKGNVVSEVQLSTKRSVISNLFTTFNIEPDSSQRQGVSVFYVWNENLNPGETLEVKVKTNWMFPIGAILFAVFAVLFVRWFYWRDLVIRKKISFIHSKKGHFALKVSLFVHAKKYMERVNIVDNVPRILKLYHRFGSELPKRIDENKGRVEWNFEKLEEGEVRILSYIMYSKVGVFGKFALPTATGIFEREGKIREVNSNKSFFIAEKKEE